LIYGKFSANSTKLKSRPQSPQYEAQQHDEGTKNTVPTVLFYGHYDVIAAENERGEWLQDPFKLSGLNGYLYGRGTSDNKVSSILSCGRAAVTNNINYRAPFYLLYLLSMSY
jgi:acetylornithine deacetylase/succinyl-diaminopimelate desuccinylase-like protein